jgi:hypothetical protein
VLTACLQAFPVFGYLLNSWATKSGRSGEEDLDILQHQGLLYQDWRRRGQLRCDGDKVGLLCINRVYTLTKFT